MHRVQAMKVLLIDVGIFCEELCQGVNEWQQNVSADVEIAAHDRATRLSPTCELSRTSGRIRTSGCRLSALSRSGACRQPPGRRQLRVVRVGHTRC